jgi:HTH-type transcriptional regulator/antitoxin HigA
MVENDSPLYEPDFVSHPGDTIVDYLETNGWSQSDLARRTGLAPKTISEICNSKASISAPTSLALEKVLQRPAHFWLNLQRRYDEAKERKRALAQLPEWDHWASRFPIAEMQKFLWLPKTKSKSDARSDLLLRFFGVSSPNSWRAVWDATNVAYRQTRKFATSFEAISVWMRATELEADELITKDFDEEKLRSLIAELRRQTMEPAEKFVLTVQSLCSQAGVAVVWVPELPNTAISGCARWLSDRKALIGLTLRYRTDDQMWFTFFHELAHILLHKKRHSFIVDNAAEDLSDSIVDPQMQKDEEEANRLASDILIPPDALSDFIKNGVYTNEAVIGFARELEIGPGIVVGRLQREYIIERHQGNKLKRTFNWEIKAS